MSRISDEEGNTLPMPISTKKTTCAPNHRVHPMHNLVDGEAGRLDWPLPPVLEGNLCDMFA